MADKTYPVKIDGVEYEVKAASPEEARAKAEQIDPATTARVIVRNGTTRVFQRPNGQKYVVSPGYSSTNPAKVAEAEAGASAEQISSKGIDEQIIAQHPYAARFHEFVRGTPLFGSRADETVGMVSPTASTSMRAAHGAMQRQRPGETLALNLGGGLAGAAGMAAALPGAVTGYLSNLPRWGRVAAGIPIGATLGGVEGAVYGSGEGTTPEERAASAAEGAKTWLLFGGAFGGAAPLVGDLVSNIANHFRRSDLGVISKQLGISKDAAKVIKNTFDQGGDMDAALARLQQAGQTGMLADAGEAAQALIDATIAAGGGAAQIAKSAITDRMATTGAEMEAALQRGLGSPAQGPVTAVGEIQSATQPQRAAAYDKFYGTAIDYSSAEGRAVENVLAHVEPKVLKQAIDGANADMRVAELSGGAPARQIMASIGSDGSVVFREMPNAQQLDAIKRSLSDLSERAKTTGGLAPIGNAESKRYGDLSGYLRDAIVDATGGSSGTYATALKLGGDTIRERNAFTAGFNMLKPGTYAEDIGLALGKSPSDVDKAAAARGVRTYIDHVIGEVRRIPSDPNIDARQALATMRTMASDNARAKMRDLLGAEAEPIIEAMDRAMVAAELRAATSANSRTAVRQAVQGTVEEITQPGPLRQAARGEPINTTKELIKIATGETGEYTAAQRQAVYADIARALTEKQGPDAIIALRAIRQAMEGQPMSEARTDALARFISNTLYGGGTTATTAGATSEWSR